MSDIEEQVTQIIVGTLGIARDKIEHSSRFQEDLGADSLEIVELVMSVEDELHIDVPDEKIETIRTVGDLTDFIKTAQRV